MVSFYFLEHRFKRSMLEITSSTSYEVLWKYLIPHKKIKLQEDITFSVAAGKKAYDIIGPLEKVCGYRSTIKILFCPFIKLNNG